MNLYDMLDAALALYETGTTEGMNPYSASKARQINELLNKYHVRDKEMFVTELMNIGEAEE